MSHAIGSKEAQAYLDPVNAPEPSHETGLNSHFGSTFAPAPKQATSTTSPRGSLSSNNPFRDESASGVRQSPPAKAGASTTTSALRDNSPQERFPKFREEIPSGAFDNGQTQAPRRTSGSHRHGPPPPVYSAVGESSNPPRRRGSSLKERFPGDKSVNPLDVIRRDSRKANRSPHLTKRGLPGADVIDRLDPALGGVAYHHEGPYDAASLARNMNPKTAPVAALKTTNAEALKATPRENIKDALEGHKPLDGTAIVPPGEQDRFGRTYQYEEGADLMREGGSDGPGYKQWAGQEYDPEDLHGKAEPAFSLDRALKTHNINDDGIEMRDHAQINKDYHRAERKGTLDNRDPVTIAGDDRKYAALEYANSSDVHGSAAGQVKRTGSISQGLKKRLGSLRHRKDRDD